jgi:site-specific recombinase XerD
MRDENLPGEGDRIRPAAVLGHANLSTTQRYMHLDERELADAQDLVE